MTDGNERFRDAVRITKRDGLPVQPITVATIYGFEAGYSEAIANIREWIKGRGHVTVAELEALLAALAKDPE